MPPNQTPTERQLMESIFATVTDLQSPGDGPESIVERITIPTEIKLNLQIEYLGADLTTMTRPQIVAKVMQQIRAGVAKAFRLAPPA